LVAGVAGEPRRLHGDLGAGYRELAETDRQIGQEPQRIEPARQENAEQPQHDADRNDDAQQPHQPAVARGAAIGAIAVAPRIDEAVAPRFAAKGHCSGRPHGESLSTTNITAARRENRLRIWP
jgi:hypothetical protein